MKVFVDKTAVLMGERAAEVTAEEIKKAIAERGVCRLLLSTGASQFEVLDALVKSELPWDKVIMFHLDEYVGMPITHVASFRKYLTERFTSRVPLRNVCFVEAEGDLNAMLAKLNAEITAAPIDVGLIGIGENGHIAFNDPPADFKTMDPYIVVNLNDTCKNQQVREGWFATPADVPAQAVSMSVHQIMMCRSVISVVPRAVKADAIAKTFANTVCAEVPATMLKMHPDWTLYLEDLSAAKLDRAAWAEYMI